MNTLPRARNTSALNRLNGGSGIGTAGAAIADGRGNGLTSQSVTRAKTSRERIDITGSEVTAPPRALWPLLAATLACLVAGPLYLALLDFPLIRSTAWPMFLLVGIGAVAGAVYARRDDRFWVRLTGSANVIMLALACVWFFWLAALPKAAAAAETLTVAPDFQLPDQDGRQIALSNLTRGGPVLLVFYRGSWCPFCVSELKGLSGISEEMQRLGVRIAAVSVDPPRSAQQAASRLDLKFPLLSDAMHSALTSYGVVHRGGGPGGEDIAIPAHFLIARDGRILWRHVAERLQDRPDPQALLKVAREHAKQS